MAWRRRYLDWMLDWMEASLPRTSTDLFARLPFGDAVTLAALAGTGRMTWPEINAALDAMIKLAAADALDRRDRYNAPPGSDAAMRIAKEEIWARYHAQCDDVFANDAGPRDTGARSPEEPWRTQWILDRLRDTRDRELAALHRRLAVRPSTLIPSAIRLKPWTELSPAERAALGTLEATGFLASEGMIEAVDNLIGEIAGKLGNDA